MAAATPAGRAGQRPGFDALQTGDAHDLLDEVGLARDVGTIGRHLDDEVVGIAARTAQLEAERRQDRLDLGAREFESGQPQHLARQGRQCGVSGRGIDPASTLSEGVPPQNATTSAVARVEAGQAERGDRRRASKQVARVRHDPESAAGRRDIRRMPQRGFDEHVGRRLVAAGRLPAHDPGDRHGGRCRRR